MGLQRFAVIRDIRLASDHHVRHGAAILSTAPFILTPSGVSRARLCSIKRRRSGCVNFAMESCCAVQIRAQDSLGVCENKNMLCRF